MLTSLIIRDVVLIEALRIDFAAGLCVLTGETGAGKSILLDSLGLALGARADAGLVRAGAAQASVTATFQLDDDHAVHALLAEQGIVGDDQLILRRVVKSDGGSRAFINDVAVSATLLREVGAALVEIHGQHDERGLLNPRGHRALLDSFAGLDGETAAVAGAWAARQAVADALSTAQAAMASAARDREWLEHAVDELQRLAPEPGEEDMLAEQRATMMKGQKLAQDMAAVDQLLNGSDGGLAQLRQAARWLERLSGEHPLFEAALVAVDRALIEADEAESRLAEAAEAFSYDAAQLEAVEGRLFELRAMARKHRVDVAGLPALAGTLAERAAALESGAMQIQRLEQALADAERTYDAAAGCLSSARRAAAMRLDAAVMQELAPLKLDAARFRTIVDNDIAGPAGRDRVEFEISTNPGAPFAPLIKIASGGELSRFILALKVALAGARSAATMIFDEIDRGVGGAVATAIGERLARLAHDRAQLLVVTHSPQVAARGAHQWRIAKSVSEGVMRTRVDALGMDERCEEIARMLSAAEVTAEARAQAARLLETVS